MNKQSLSLLIALIVTTCLLAGCAPGAQKFSAPEIDPPADLVPAYLPEGFTLIQGFELTHDGDISLSASDEEVEETILRMKLGDPAFSMKSPEAKTVQGIYFQGKEHLILITKSAFPGGTLDTWRTAFEDSWPKPCECSCLDIRIPQSPLFERMNKIQEVRTIGTTQVAILQGFLGTTTVFMRGDDLLTIESGIPLEENLKIVESLLQD